jgi:bifunctional non-homologous end joining protein LigD
MSAVLDELQRRVRRSVSFEPSLPHPAKEPPSGPGWLHEIKHDGFRIDFAQRYPLIVDAARSLRVRSCIVDGEAIMVNDDGLSVFDFLCYRRHDHAVTLCAFDLIEIDGNDLRRHSIEDRKWQLVQLLRQRHHGIAINETHAGDGAIIYRHACTLGCEGIVSKRMGRTDVWIKTKSRDSPAVKRERESDWAKR